MNSNQSMDNKIRFSIFSQILLTLIVVSLIPLIGLWYISISKSKQDWTSNIFQKLADTTDSLCRNVDDWTSMNLKVLEQNSGVPAIQSMEGKAQVPVLKSITKVYDYIYLAFTILPDGQNIGRSDDNPPTTYGDREYFQQVLAGKQLGQQVLMGKTSGKPALILAKPIKGEGAKNLGVIAIAMTLEDISKTIANTKIGETGYAILLDDKNRLIAHGKGAITSELQDFSTHPVLKNQHRFDRDTFFFNENGKSIVAYSQRTKLGWTLIMQQDYKEAFLAADEAQRNAVILLVITLIMVLLIAFLLARRLSVPIRNLTIIADEISRGNLEARIVESERSDEIGALARAIERMGVSLKMAFDRLRKR
jgi:methyl-accepting chemotaxis protein